MKNESKKAAAKTETATATKALQAPEKPQAAPKAESKPQTPEAVKALWEKAKAAKNAADLGLLPQEQAAALWAEAEAASKPTPEALDAAEKAKTAKQAAEKKESAAKAAFTMGLLDEAVFKATEAEANAAREAYKKAAIAAKGFGPGAGGRCKGQMSGLEAAFQVLAKAEKAMRVGEMADAAIEQGLWAPEGQTPKMTLSAAIQRELKKGAESRFIKTEAGLFTARKSG